MLGRKAVCELGLKRMKRKRERERRKKPEIKVEGKSTS
jgi:formylmethanofuran dehydrogenase subunit B